MKYVIRGREYPTVDRSTAQLIHLMELRQQTRAWTEDGKGLGMQALDRLETEAKEDDDAKLLAFAVLLFLSRRAAGDKVTFEEAAAVAFDDVEIVKEPGDEPAASEAESLPTEPDGQETPGPSGATASSDGTPSPSMM